MSADPQILEALARIEHKIDLFLWLVLGGDQKTILRNVGDVNHVCPVCQNAVEYQIDVNEGVVLRKCGCKTGKVALNLGAFAPPALPTKKEQEDEQRSDEEDRRDPSRRRGPTGRR